MISVALFNTAVLAGKQPYAICKHMGIAGCYLAKTGSRQDLTPESKTHGGRICFVKIVLPATMQ